MCRAYLRSSVFYLFWFRPTSRQHPAFEMYICSVLLVCLFIVFVCELVWNVLVNQKGFLYITIVEENEFHLSLLIRKHKKQVFHYNCIV